MAAQITPMMVIGLRKGVRIMAKEGRGQCVHMTGTASGNTEKSHMGILAAKMQARAFTPHTTP